MAMRGLSVVLAVLGLAAAQWAYADGRRITILHTNDMHGRHAPIEVAPGNATAQTGDPGRPPSEFDRAGRIGGFATIASIVRKTRKEEGEESVLLLDAGDTFSDDYVGNQTRGKAIVDLMNRLGYDFMALGNHDFDHGFDRTRELQALARFPMRGANVLHRGEPVFGEPYRIFTKGGIRIAVLALGYHNTGETGSKKNTEELRFVSGLESARRYVPELEKKSDLIVVLSHQGTAVDRKLAREIDGVDVIVGGHSHDRIVPPEKVGETWIVQAMSDGTHLGRLHLTVDGKRLTNVEGEVIELWNDRIPADPEFKAAVDKVDALHRAGRDEVIATATQRIGRQYKSESPFDALVGNILREHGQTEVAFLPGVGYGVSLDPGPVTRGELYTLIPHPSKFVTLRMTGEQILQVLEQSATNLEPADELDAVGGLVQTSGISWTLNLGKPGGSRVRDVRIAGAPIDRSATYTVATHAGMLGGLHRYEFKVGTDIRTHDETVTDIVEDALRKQGKVSLPELGQVRLIKASGS